MVNLKLRVYELPLRFVHVKFETSGIWAPLRTFFIASLKIQVCGYTPILGLVIYDCLPDYAVPEFWRRPLMGPGAKVEKWQKMQKGQKTKNFTSAFPSGFELKASRPPGCNGGVRLSFMADLFTVVPYRSHIIYIVHALIPAVPASQQDFYSILQHWNSRYATATTTTTATIAITSQSVYKISDTDLHIVITSDDV